MVHTTGLEHRVRLGHQYGASTTSPPRHLAIKLDKVDWTAPDLLSYDALVF